jgi:hypothetical protein
MADYLWQPYKDTLLDSGVYNRSTNEGFSLLTPMEATAYPCVSWDYLHSGDVIHIYAHGGRFNPKKIGWLDGQKLVTWDSGKLAYELAMKMTDTGKFQLPFEFRLSACWGANAWLLNGWKSFGQRLYEKMYEIGFCGSLTCYRGATIINSMGDYVRGTGRITSFILSNVNVNQNNIQRLASNPRSPVVLDADKHSKTWELNPVHVNNPLFRTGISGSMEPLDE